MFILKMLRSIVLLPVYLILLVSGIIISFIVNAMAVVKGIIGLGLTALIIGCIVCYQDWIQVAFLLCLSVILFMILFAGVIVEELFHFAREKVLEIMFA